MQREGEIKKYLRRFSVVIFGKMELHGKIRRINYGNVSSSFLNLLRLRTKT
jgi:hypothetical protein